MKICYADSCDRVVIAKGLCQAHYQRLKIHDDLQEGIPIRRGPIPDKGMCTFPGCDDPAKIRDLCWGHIKQLRDTGEMRPKRGATPARICQFDGCDRKHARHGWCSQHAYQALTGKPMYPIGQRPRVDRSINTHGYAQVFRPDHPNARKAGWVGEHTVVMSEMIGRPLLPHENVHHINGVRDDNRPENLELWSHSQPKGQRVHDKSEWAIQILQTYRPDALVPSLRVDATPERK